MATVTGRSRLEMLRKSTYQSSQVEANINLYDLAEAVMLDAGLAPTDFEIDDGLKDTVIPYAWFEPISHREALRRIAEAGIATVYDGRDGITRIVPFASGGADVLEIPPDQYFRADNPQKYSEVANEVIVETQPLQPQTEQEIYRSNDPITVPAGKQVSITAYYNETPAIDTFSSLEYATHTTVYAETFYGWGANITLKNTGGTDENVILVIEGKPLKVTNRERAIARNEASIGDLGVIRYELKNPLIQSRAVAQQIADLILATVSDPGRDINLDWRGNPALELGDRITSKGGEYMVIKNEIKYDGGLRERTIGRRAK